MATQHSRVRFKEVKDFPGYYVGTDGSIWSTWRRAYLKGFGRGVRYETGGPWWKMKPTAQPKYGYFDVQLRRDGRAHHRLVSRLVLLAFRGTPPEEGMEAAHEDNDRANNRLDNLTWKTKKDNQADRLRHGTDSRGEKHGANKLTAVAVVMIMDEWANGATLTALGQRFGVNRTTVSRIVKGKAWSHVQPAAKRS